MTEVRDLANEACGYVKLYPNGVQIAGQVGNETGTAMEFLDSNGYVVLISTDGCEETTLYRGNDLENVIGTQEALPKGDVYKRQPRSWSLNPGAWRAAIMWAASSARTWWS